MAEASDKHRQVDDDGGGGGGGEVPPLLDDEYGDFSDAVVAALWNYDEDMLQRITDKYTVDAQDSDGFSLLMFAASMGSVASVRFLIERGAAVNIQDNGKNTALHLVCDPDKEFRISDEEFEEMLLLLLRAGADTTIKDIDGMTPRDVPLRDLFFF